MQQQGFLYDTYHYHTSNSHLCMGANVEALQLHAVDKKAVFLVQATQESVSVLPSHTRIHIRYYKSRACIWMCNGLYDKIVITIVPSYTRQNITHLLPLTLLLVPHTCNTDGNKVVIFSGVALFYVDTYLFLMLLLRHLAITWKTNLSCGYCMWTLVML